MEKSPKTASAPHYLDLDGIAGLHREPALEHLAAGVKDRPDLAASARDDADLAPIRNDPRFPA